MKRSGNGETAFDVLVAGGGVSGTAAAVAAARSGARTLLVERARVLGGTGVSALLRHICGLYLNGDEYPSGTLNGGITAEVAKGLGELSSRSKPVKTGKVYVLPYSGVHLRQVLDSLCSGEPGLSVLLGAATVSVSAADGRIREVTVCHRGERTAVRPRAVVDCTGDGEVAYMAGASVDDAENGLGQLAGYSVRLRGISEQDEMLPVKVPYHLARAVREKLLPPSFRYTGYIPGDFPDEGYCKFSIEGPPGMEREAVAEKNAQRAVHYLAGEIPAFGNCYIVETSAGVFDREGRRLRGEYTLTEEDVLGARKFPGGGVKNSWPVELWNRDKGPVYGYVKAGDYYEIPLWCQKSMDMENLFSAGRCISVTHRALGSTRVMGACMALGEQAGRAAAEVAEKQREETKDDK